MSWIKQEKRKMNTLRIMFLVHCLVLLKVCSGASVDRFESGKPRTTEVNLLHTSEKTNITGLQADNGTSVGDDDYEEDYEGDYELNLPRVAFSTKPKHPSAMPTTEKTKKKKKEGQRKRQREEEEPLRGGIQRFLHSWSVSLSAGFTHPFLCMSWRILGREMSRIHPAGGEGGAALQPNRSAGGHSSGSVPHVSCSNRYSAGIKVPQKR